MGTAGTWVSDAFCDLLIFFHVCSQFGEKYVDFPSQFLQMFAIDGDSNPGHRVNGGGVDVSPQETDKEQRCFFFLQGL